MKSSLTTGSASPLGIWRNGRVARKFGGESNYSAITRVVRRSRELRLRGRANRLEPAANVDLRMGFSAEMAGSGCVRRIAIPLEHGEIGITALDHEPVIWVIRDPATNFASELLQGCHAMHLDW
jgi:hypothetical protein